MLGEDSLSPFQSMHAPRDLNHVMSGLQTFTILEMRRKFIKPNQDSAPVGRRGVDRRADGYVTADEALHDRHHLIGRETVQSKRDITSDGFNFNMIDAKL